MNNASTSKSTDSDPSKIRKRSAEQNSDSETDQMCSAIKRQKKHLSPTLGFLKSFKSAVAGIFRVGNQIICNLNIDMQELRQLKKNLDNGIYQLKTASTVVETRLNRLKGLDFKLPMEDNSPYKNDHFNCIVYTAENLDGICKHFIDECSAMSCVASDTAQSVQQRTVHKLHALRRAFRSQLPLLVELKTRVDNGINESSNLNS